MQYRQIKRMRKILLRKQEIILTLNWSRCFLLYNLLLTLKIYYLIMRRNLMLQIWSKYIVIVFSWNGTILECHEDRVANQIHYFVFRNKSVQTRSLPFISQYFIYFVNPGITEEHFVMQYNSISRHTSNFIKSLNRSLKFFNLLSWIVRPRTPGTCSD